MLRLFRLLIDNVVDDVEDDAAVDDEVDGSEGGGCGIKDSNMYIQREMKKERNRG